MAATRLQKIPDFVLGMESLDGTVIEKRIKDTLALGAKKNTAYKPRVGGTNKNLKNYRPEQMELVKTENEEIFHIFGYADMSKEGKEYADIESHTPFMDFEGKAKQSSKDKYMYYKKLNEIAFERRM